MSTPLFQDKVAEIFVKVDDFCNLFELEFKKYSLPSTTEQKKRNRKAALSNSEIITILNAFHSGQFRNFKHFYLNYVCVHQNFISATAAYSFFPKNRLSKKILKKPTHSLSLNIINPN